MTSTRVGLTQRVSVVEEHGERRDCLDQQWTTLLDELGCTPVPLPNRLDSDDVGPYLDSLALDALVLTSGNDLMTVDSPSNPAPERDQFEIAAVEYAIDMNLPVVGICRGLELLNVYFGGQLKQINSHVACTHRVEFSDVDQVVTDGLSLPEKTAVNSYHNWGINKAGIGDNLVVLATALDGTVECITHETDPIWGIMWHPERESPSTTFDRELLTTVL